VLVTVSAVGFIFSSQIMTLFRKEDLAVIAIGSRALKFHCFCFPLSAWIIVTNMLLQTIGKATEASIIAVSARGYSFFRLFCSCPANLD